MKVFSIAAVLADLWVGDVSAQQPDRHLQVAPLLPAIQFVTELESAFDGHGVPLRGDWNNQDVGRNDTGQYYLFHPEHWQQVFGTTPATGPETTYEVEIGNGIRHVDTS